MIRKISCILGILIFILLLIPPSYVTAKSVSIPSVDIVGTIRKDGTVQIIEKRTIDFNGDFTYGFYDLPKAGFGSIDEFSISDGSTPFVLDKIQTKKNGTYFIEDQLDKTKILYYFTASNEKKTFTIQYVIKDSIALYEDFGQFYWKLQGDGWDFPIQSFTAVLKWESAIQKDMYRIWAHGPLWGDFTKTDEFSSNLKIDELPNKTFVEVRILLPTSYFTMQPNKTGTILNTAVAEETKLADDSNAEREEAKRLMALQKEQERIRREKLIKVGNMVQWLLYILALFMVVLLINLYKKYGAEYKIANEAIYYREPPSTIKPAIAGMLFNFQKYTDTFLQATILDLIRRKWIQYEEIEGNIFTRDHRMTKLSNPSDSLNEYETKLMDEILFDKEASITIKGLKSKFNQSRTVYYSAFQSYLAQIKADVTEKGYFDTKSNTISILVMVLGILMIFFSIIFGVSLSVFFFGSPKIGFIVLLPIGILYCLSFGALRRRTEKGKEEFVKWRAFRSFLKDFSNLKEYGPKSLIIWEQFLVYATVFGIASVVLRALKVVAPTLTDTENGSLIGPSYFMAGAMPSFGGLQKSLSSISSAVNNIPKTASSSSSSGFGGGGGFSGGGGGGGGGSGGGFG